MEGFIMSFCTKCGAQMPDGSAFCTKCGAPMGQAAPAQAAPQAQPQQFNQPQQGFQQPYQQGYQQPYQPVDYMASLKKNSKVIKIVFAAINALLFLSILLPYFVYEDYNDKKHYINRFVHGGSGDSLGLLIATLAIFTIAMLFSQGKKIFITLISCYNFILTLIMLISGGKAKESIGYDYAAGFVFVIISIVFLGVGTLLYFLSAEDKK